MAIGEHSFSKSTRVYLSRVTPSVVDSARRSGACPAHPPQVSPEGRSGSHIGVLLSGGSTSLVEAWICEHCGGARGTDEPGPSAALRRVSDLAAVLTGCLDFRASSAGARYGPDGRTLELRYRVLRARTGVEVKLRRPMGSDGFRALTPSGSPVRPPYVAPDRRLPRMHPCQSRAQ